MRCLAEFLLDSDLCLKADGSPLTLNAPDNAFSLRLTNAVNAAPDAVLIVLETLKRLLNNLRAQGLSVKRWVKRFTLG
jgi:hypothetical protein